MTELIFKNNVRKKLLEMFGPRIIVNKLESSTSPGIPDLLVILADKVLFIETKVGSNGLRDTQKAWFARYFSGTDHLGCFVLRWRDRGRIELFSRHNIDLDSQLKASDAERFGSLERALRRVVELGSKAGVDGAGSDDPQV